MRHVMRSSIGMCVRQGLPNIGSVAGLSRALLRARSVALSAAGSGEYVSKKLFQRLGIEAEIGPQVHVLRQRVRGPRRALAYDVPP